MDGPGHYREAEGALRAIVDGTLYHAEVANLAAIARAHATLALVAATAEAHDPNGVNVPDWSEVLR